MSHSLERGSGRHTCTEQWPTETSGWRGHRGLPMQDAVKGRVEWSDVDKEAAGMLGQLRDGHSGTAQSLGFPEGQNWCGLGGLDWGSQGLASSLCTRGSPVTNLSRGWMQWVQGACPAWSLDLTAATSLLALCSPESLRMIQQVTGLILPSKCHSVVAAWLGGSFSGSRLPKTMQGTWCFNMLIVLECSSLLPGAALGIYTAFSNAFSSSWTRAWLFPYKQVTV